MKAGDTPAARMMALFAGYSKASGTHGEPDEQRPNGKWAIKNTARTLAQGPSLQWWEQHLAGERPLGVVPILEDSSCRWGCIDVDSYDIDLLKLVGRVESMRLPLVPCRSKSGGLHLFCLTDEPVSAEQLVAALKCMAATLGLADAEVFPKQAHIDESSSGNWIVMPYFGGDFGGKLKMQYGLKRTGAEQTIEEFLRLAEQRRVSISQLAALATRPARPAVVASSASKHNRLKAEVVSLDNARENKAAQRAQRRREIADLSADPNEAFADGPPCLQKLARGGFPEGSRNNALLQLGIYSKRAFPDAWKEQLEADNQRYMRPPLPRDEVLQVQRQLEKKLYNYRCKDQPMSGACDQPVCIGRQFGIGDGARVPVVERIVVYASEEPVFHIKLKGYDRWIKTADARDISDFKRFRNMCIAQLHTTFAPLTDAFWTLLYSFELENAEVKETPIDLTPLGEFKNLLESFLTNRRRAAHSEGREALLRGAPWEDEESGRYEFTMPALTNFLKQEGFKHTRMQPYEWIKALGGGPLADNEQNKTKVKGKLISIWWVPANAVQETPELDPPALPKEHV
ncbi:TOTE conflict system archaeo-eukaryotic primase domain-containing protein [Bradyrhizobium centrosematis]|uniref:TOTE conflict system archaeo-eukaryotic primase domain-containing protein n=1 Tax=Bradyrhizobium centrosematis TaxID=1300039 RepID=UPI00388D97CB